MTVTISGIFDSQAQDRVALISADMADVTVIWDNIQLRDRMSSAPLRPFIILAGADSGAPRGRGTTWLPEDLVEGDLLAVPYVGMKLPEMFFAPAVGTAEAR